MLTMAGARYFFLVFAALYAFGQPAGTGVIGGVVIDKASGDPVRKAIVTVTWHGEPRSWATVRTGSDGRFRVEGLPAGNYEVRAQKPGIGSAIYGVDRLSETGELIALENGQTRDDLILRFLHAASISGRVVDSDGDPIPASVMLYRQGRNLGEKSWCGRAAPRRMNAASSSWQISRPGIIISAPPPWIRTAAA